jgi:hypothetical protein
MRYVMMRLSLARRDEGTIFQGLPPRQSRQVYLQEVFGQEIQFEHYANTYVYEPFRSPEQEKIAGVIGREHGVVIGRPPEEKFAREEISDWETANVLIDSSDHPDGQKVAMQVALGQPPAIFRSLVDHINETHQAAEWIVAVYPITRREEFWTAVERYRGHITEVDFSFAVPNIWGGQTETEKALRELKEQNNAQEVEVKIKNKDAKLNPDSTRVRDSVEYVARGGGTAQIRDETQTPVYSSDAECRPSALVGQNELIA